jgi:chorismate mutase
MKRIDVIKKAIAIVSTVEDEKKEEILDGLEKLLNSVEKNLNSIREYQAKKKAGKIQ